MKFTFPTETGEINIPIETGSVIFVLGANGTGKSSLMHKLFAQNKENSKRILAHRKTWFRSNAMDMTAASKKQTESHISNYDRSENSRWMDDYYEQRSSLSIFDLIDSENVRARTIANAVDNDNIDLAKKLSLEKAPIQTINELLKISNLPIQIQLGEDDQLFAKRNGSEDYSIAELSDGERNALLIGADVLTAKPNTLIIIDEPERHLHRSIISPLLTSLFQKRSDCSFVISTHDVYLPLDNNDSNVLMLRGCKWSSKKISSWDADYLQNCTEISKNIRKDILGAKREILFVEGDYESLDRQIYQLIYPPVTVIAQGSCVDVENAVEGIKNTGNLHWINAVGLIDADDRTSEQLEKLRNKGVIALKCYSVEYLYYNINTIKKVADKVADLIGTSSNELLEKAKSKILQGLLPHKKRLASRVCERKVRNMVFGKLPKHNDIAVKESFNIEIDLKSEIEREERIFEDYYSKSDYDNLLARYPFRETSVLNDIVKSLGFQERYQYEGTVRKMIVDDVETLKFYRELLKDLTNEIMKE